MGRPQKVSDEVVVRAAARAIAAKGPNSVTVADVSELAGIAPATIMERFGSKRNLLLAVAAGGAAHVETTFAAASDRHRHPLRAIETALTDLAAGLGDAAEASNHLAFLALDLTEPEFRAHIAAFNAQLAAQLRALLQAAVDTGALRSGNCAGLAEQLQATYHGTLLLWSIDQQGDLRSRLRRQIRFTLEPYRTAPPGSG